jgi:hypothetical protein
MPLTAERLREVVSYNQETGVFMRRSNGAVAGTRKDNGYLHFCVDTKKYGAHRLAWLYVRGEWPIGDIDHIDGNRANNAIKNLRDVDRSTNLENQRQAKSHNKSTGVLGAYLHKQTGKFMSRIQVRGKGKYLGLFDTVEEAHHAYVEAKRQLHEGNTL